MNYQEILQTLKKQCGINLNVKTLRRYLKAGLLKEPGRKHTGCVAGIVLTFNKDVIAEVYAAWRLLHDRPTMSRVKKARASALKVESKKEVSVLLANEDNIFSESAIERYLAERYRLIYEKIKQGYTP